MGLSTGTLASNRATDVRLMLPKWGVWHAEVTIDGEVQLAGQVPLVLADLTCNGTIISGGPALGRSIYRIAGGRGTWGKTVGEKCYANDAGVKLSKVLGEAAADCGEAFSYDGKDAAGVAWTRQAGPACTQLNLLAPQAWYVDELGTTRLGARAPGALVGQVTRVTPADLARGKVVLAAESIATILPGVVVDGITAVDVMHELSPATGLRSTVWGAQAGSTLDSFRALIAQLDPDRNFRGVTEYLVDTLDGELMNLQPVRVSSGMPYLKRVPVWPGVPGCRVRPALGSRVLVGFVDSDPARPHVSGFEGGSASGDLTLITDGLGAGGHAVTLEQVLGLFAQYTAARFTLGDLGATYSPIYSAAPPASLATLIALMTVGAVAPTAVGPTPGGLLDALGLPALIATALAAQVIAPDPASIGLPTPVFPGLGKKGLHL